MYSFVHSDLLHGWVAHDLWCTPCRLIKSWFLYKYLIQVIANDKRTNGQTDGQAFSMNWLAEKEIPKCCYIFAKSDFIFAKKLQTWFAKKNNGLQRNI